MLRGSSRVVGRVVHRVTTMALYSLHDEGGKSKNAAHDEAVIVEDNYTPWRTFAAGSGHGRKCVLLTNRRAVVQAMGRHDNGSGR